MLPDRTLSGIPLVGVGEGKCGVCSQPVGCRFRGKSQHLPLMLSDEELSDTERASFTVSAKDGISTKMVYVEGGKTISVSDILLEQMLARVEPSLKAAFLEILRKWDVGKHVNREAATAAAAPAATAAAAAAEKEEEEGAG